MSGRSAGAGVWVMRKAWRNFSAHRAFFFRYTWALKRQAARQGRRLKLLAGPPNGAAAGAVIAIVPYYGEHRMLAWFLNYYRKLGVSFFTFLDVSADRDLNDRLGETVDCAVWRPEGFMHPSKTLHALNFLRHRYARDKWCLSVEPSDLLVFPKSESRHIRDLIDFVSSEQRYHVYAVVVDAYGDRPAREIDFPEGGSPSEHLRFFDRIGYQTLDSGEHHAIPIMGGVQRRALYGNEPQIAPVLNRIPLVRLSWDAYYLASTRLLVPSRFNSAHSPWHSSTTACLLRFAMLSDEVSLHIAKQAEDGQFLVGHVTPLYAGTEKMAAMTLKIQGSWQYGGTQDLLDCGLLNNGQWF